jgi:hypothetical protein
MFVLLCFWVDCAWGGGSFLMMFGPIPLMESREEDERLGPVCLGVRIPSLRQYNSTLQG